MNRRPSPRFIINCCTAGVRGGGVLREISHGSINIRSEKHPKRECIDRFIQRKHISIQRWWKSTEKVRIWHHPYPKRYGRSMTDSMPWRLTPNNCGRVFKFSKCHSHTFLLNANYWTLYKAVEPVINLILNFFFENRDQLPTLQTRL